MGAPFPSFLHVCRGCNKQETEGSERKGQEKSLRMFYNLISPLCGSKSVDKM